MIYLKEITEENFNECLNLKVNVENEDYVDEVVYSFAEAYIYYNSYILRAIYLEDTIIGFVSIYVGENSYQIINFLIDDNYRNKGYGKEAVNIIIDYLKCNYNAKLVSVPVYIENREAHKFWSKLNFNNSEVIENNYIFMRREI